MGRPKGKDAETGPVSTRIPLALILELDRRAKKEKRSRASLLRIIIEAAGDKEAQTRKEV